MDKLQELSAAEISNDLGQDAYSCVDIIRVGTTEGKAQVVFAIDGIDEESVARRQQYAVLQRQPLHVLRKNMLRQVEPDEKPACGACPPSVPLAQVRARSLRLLTGLLQADLEALLDPKGDPMSLVNWTTKSVGKLKEALTSQGHRLGETAISKRLHAMGFSLRANKKTIEGRGMKTVMPSLDISSSSASSLKQQAIRSSWWIARRRN